MDNGPETINDADGVDAATANIRGPTEDVKKEVTENTSDTAEPKKEGATCKTAAMGRSVERHRDEAPLETFEADVAAGTGLNLDTREAREKARRGEEDTKIPGEKIRSLSDGKCTSIILLHHVHTKTGEGRLNNRIHRVTFLTCGKHRSCMLESTPEEVKVSADGGAKESTAAV